MKIDYHIHNSLIDLDISDENERDEIDIHVSITPALFLSIAGVVLVVVMAAVWIAQH